MVESNGVAAQAEGEQLLDRRYFEQELGISDPQEIVAMVRSLEAQLNSLYQDIDNEGGSR